MNTKLYCDSFDSAVLNAEYLISRGFEVFFHSYVTYDKEKKAYLNYYLIYRGGNNGNM